MKLSETERHATKWYERLDIHREHALPTDVVIDRQEFVKLLKLVHDTSYTYKPIHKLWKEVIQNIEGTQANGHPSQGQRLSLKELSKSAITVGNLFTYMERTEKIEAAK